MQRQRAIISNEENFYDFGSGLATLTFMASFRKTGPSRSVNDEAKVSAQFQIEYNKSKKYSNFLNINDFPVFEQLDHKSGHEKLIAFRDKILFGDQDRHIIKFFSIGYAFTELNSRYMVMASMDNIPIEIKIIAEEIKKIIHDILVSLQIDNNLIVEFDTITENFNADSLNLFEKKLRQQLFQPVNKPLKYSELDKSRPVSEEYWVVSLVRKPDGVHSQHAFLVLEGKEDNRSLIWFIDFVGEPILSGMANGKVRMYDYQDEKNEKLLFRCDRPMMNIRRGDRVLYTSWNIPKASAQELIADITMQKEHPPIFNLLGKNSIFGITTGAASSCEVGHNCFTWSKEKLFNLNLDHIQLPAPGVREWVISATSAVLGDPARPAWYQRPVGIAAIAAVAAVGGAVLARNAPAPSAIIEQCTIQ